MLKHFTIASLILSLCAVGGITSATQVIAAETNTSTVSEKKTRRTRRTTFKYGQTWKH